MRALGERLSRNRLKKLIKTVDVDKNGKLDFPEFLTLMARKASAAHDDADRKMIKDAFQAMWRNDGCDGPEYSPLYVRSMKCKKGENEKIGINEGYLNSEEVNFPTARRLVMAWSWRKTTVLSCTFA